MSEQPRKSPVHAVIRSHGSSPLESVKSCFPSYDFIPSLPRQTPDGALRCNQIGHLGTVMFPVPHFGAVFSLVHLLRLYFRREQIIQR